MKQKENGEWGNGEMENILFTYEIVTSVHYINQFFDLFLT